MSDSREVLADLTPRLTASAEAIADARKQLELELERRDGLVVQAKTEGMSQKAIARAARISQPHVVRIVAGAEPGLVLPS